MLQMSEIIWQNYCEFILLKITAIKITILRVFVIILICKICILIIGIFVEIKIEKLGTTVPNKLFYLFNTNFT